MTALARTSAKHTVSAAKLSARFAPQAMLAARSLSASAQRILGAWDMLLACSRALYVGVIDRHDTTTLHATELICGWREHKQTHSILPCQLALLNVIASLRQTAKRIE